MKYSAPHTLYEALTLARESLDAGGPKAFAFVAGGTDLLTRIAVGSAPNHPEHLIDISSIESLKTIDYAPDEDRLTIGASVRLSDLILDPIILSHFPTIVEAASAIASPPIRSSATIGGNLLCENRCIYYDQSQFWRSSMGGCLKSGSDICIATGSNKNCYSVFVSDLTPVLICLGAEVEIYDHNGNHWLPLDQVYGGDGLHPHAIAPESLIAHIRIPLASEGRMFFKKIRPRESVDFTSLTIAIRLSSSGEKLAINVAASGLGPGPVWLKDYPIVDAEAVFNKLFSQTQIIDNVAYQRLYRKQMLNELLTEGIARVTLP